MQEKNKPINKTHTVKSVGQPMPIVDYIKTMNRLYGSDGGAVEVAPKQIIGTQLDLFKHGTPPKKDSLTDKELSAHLIASPTKTQHKMALDTGKKILEEKKLEAARKPERRDHFKHYQKTGQLLEPTKEEIRRAKLPSAWDTIYDSMTPIEKGQWNREKRKKGMNGKTAEPLVKEFRSDSPDTYLSHPDQQKGMLLATLEDAKPKPKKINPYAEVKIPIPTIDDSLLRDPGQNDREATLEKMRVYAFTPRPNPDEAKGIGSFRNKIGRKLKAAESKRNWERSRKTIYER